MQVYTNAKITLNVLVSSKNHLEKVSLIDVGVC